VRSGRRKAHTRSGRRPHASPRSLAQILAFRTALAGAGVGALVGGTAAGAWYRLMRRPLPKQRGTIKVPGIETSVEIRRDRWGVHARSRSQPSRPLVRTGLLPRSGSAVAARALPAHGSRPDLRDRRPAGAGCRSNGPHAWLPARLGARRRRAGGRSSWRAGGLLPRCECSGAAASASG